MEFSSVLENRRSIRSFTGEVISEEIRKKLLRAANASPVGLAKYESLHLTVIRDPELLAEIEENTAQLFGGVRRNFLYGAPELILVSAAATDNVGYSNAAIVVHDMALAAVDAGVGACHIWGCVVALSKNAGLIRKLGIPEGFTPACAVAVGMTDEVYSPREIPDDRISCNVIG